jgi:outer membrane protein assembly factor BamB
VVVGPYAVVGSSDGRLYVVSTEAGEEVEALDVGAAISASPAVVDGWVFVGAEDGVFHAFGPKGSK